MEEEEEEENSTGWNLLRAFFKLAKEYFTDKLNGFFQFNKIKNSLGLNKNMSPVRDYQKLGVVESTTNAHFALSTEYIDATTKEVAFVTRFCSNLVYLYIPGKNERIDWEKRLPKFLDTAQLECFVEEMKSKLKIGVLPPPPVGPSFSKEQHPLRYLIPSVITCIPGAMVILLQKVADMDESKDEVVLVESVDDINVKRIKMIYRPSQLITDICVNEYLRLLLPLVKTTIVDISFSECENIRKDFALGLEKVRQYFPPNLTQHNVIIPIKLENHFQVALLEKNRIVLVDSLRSENNLVFDRIKSLLEEFYKVPLEVERFSPPQQNNGTDCGIFSIMFCVIAAKLYEDGIANVEERSFHCFDQDDVSSLRLQFASDLLRRKPFPVQGGSTYDEIQSIINQAILRVVDIAPLPIVDDDDESVFVSQKLVKDSNVSEVENKRLKQDNEEEEQQPQQTFTSSTRRRSSGRTIKLTEKQVEINEAQQEKQKTQSKQTASRETADFLKMKSNGGKKLNEIDFQENITLFNQRIEEKINGSTIVKGGCLNCFTTWFDTSVNGYCLECSENKWVKGKKTALEKAAFPTGRRKLEGNKKDAHAFKFNVENKSVPLLVLRGASIPYNIFLDATHAEKRLVVSIQLAVTIWRPQTKSGTLHYKGFVVPLDAGSSALKMVLK